VEAIAMTIRPLAVVAFVAGCMQSHQGTQALSTNDCYACHATDYQNTQIVAQADPAVPDHTTVANQAVYDHQCADCHNTTTWYSHPEKLFPISSGAHFGADCAQCHTNPDDNSGDAHGANTQCAFCHPATEVVSGLSLVDNHTMHNNNIFPDSHHSPTGLARPCTDCHTSTPPTTFDGYTNPPTGFTAQNFCLSCHPTGQGSNRSDAPCTKCHRDAHNQDRPDPEGCLAQGCHRGGRGGG
jgi:hypothetical protein